MNVYLGNLRTDAALERLGINEIVPFEEAMKIEEMRMDFTRPAKDKLHIYDIPFVIMCGSQEVHNQVVDILWPYRKMMTSKIMIGIDLNSEVVK